VYHLFYKKDFWEEVMVRPATFAAASVACACLISVALTAPAPAEEPAAPAIVSPEKLKWNPTPFPGVTVAVVAGNLTGSGMYAIMAKYNAGAKSVPHTHPDQRVVTVVSGTYYSGSGTEFDESKLKPITAGTTIIVPANAPHYALAKDGETVLVEVGTAPSGTNIWPKAAAK
jgi:quercetin dioxygenase-like cupin family protein